MQAARNLPQSPTPSQGRRHIRAAHQRRSGIFTFYISSSSRPGVEYAIQHIRRAGMRRWQCSCPQFFYRCVARRRHCKHLHALRLLTEHCRGVSRLVEQFVEVKP
jgi:hypothetical protein